MNTIRSCNIRVTYGQTLEVMSKNVSGRDQDMQDVFVWISPLASLLKPMYIKF